MSYILDDVWESDNAESSPEISLDTKKLRENHSKRGYLDGVTKSKDTNLQEGFDNGFPTGASLGLQVGRLLGTLQALVSKYGDENDILLEDFKIAQSELHIQKVLTKSMFDPDLNLQKEHMLIKRWRGIVEMHCHRYSSDVSL